MTELKPCPFCGEAVIMTSRHVDDLHGFWHKSMTKGECPLRVGVFVHHVSKEKAAEIWNRRADE